MWWFRGYRYRRRLRQQCPRKQPPRYVLYCSHSAAPLLSWNRAESNHRTPASECLPQYAPNQSVPYNRRNMAPTGGRSFPAVSCELIRRVIVWQTLIAMEGGVGFEPTAFTGARCCASESAFRPYLLPTVHRGERESPESNRTSDRGRSHKYGVSYLSCRDT